MFLNIKLVYKIFFYMFCPGYLITKSIYKFGLSVCLSVCLFVSNKRQNG